MRLASTFICVATLFVALPGSAIGQEQLWSQLNKEAAQLYKKGQTTEALALAEKAHAMAEQVFPENDLRIATSLSIIATI
ncbi:MAG: hypothetical protein QG577_2852, partial [Thermodesulfobacteriota bacterium]|nr:hypothetical protein [Thermodesulfobacteriota bacterium]